MNQILELLFAATVGSAITLLAIYVRTHHNPLGLKANDSRLVVERLRQDAQALRLKLSAAEKRNADLERDNESLSMENLVLFHRSAIYASALTPDQMKQLERLFAK